MQPKASFRHPPLISAIISPSLPTLFQHKSCPPPPPPSTMDIHAGRDRDNGAKKMSRAREEGKQQKQSGGSFWAAMAALNNRSQLGGESKNSSSSSERKKKKTTNGRSFTCGGSSICGTKESAVLIRGSRRSSAASSSRSLKAPGSGGDAFSSVSVSAVSASSSFNSETTVATTATTVSSSLSSSSSAASALSSPLSSIRPGGSGSFRKNLSGGCYYEGHDDPSAAAAAAAMAMTMLPCADCDAVFPNAESLELHRSSRHAVSELGAGDTSRNVVELIFRSSWKKPPSPSCRIERILKVRSSDDAAAGFERYRARVMESAARGGATRCAADGNELLRFHCTAFHCSLGLAGSAAALCRASPPAEQCKLCGIIRDGFSVDGDGKIATTATSGLAHDMAPDGGGGGEKRAMLVCRVVAGRVKKKKKDGNGGGSDSSEEFGYDSVSRSTSCSSELDELFVFDPRAILPCFVVIYTVAN